MDTAFFRKTRRPKYKGCGGMQISNVAEVKNAREVVSSTGIEHEITALYSPSQYGCGEFGATRNSRSGRFVRGFRTSKCVAINIGE